MGYDIEARAYLVLKFKLSDILESINSENYKPICCFLDICNVRYSEFLISDIITEYFTTPNASDTNIVDFIASRGKKKGPIGRENLLKTRFESFHIHWKNNEL